MSENTSEDLPAIDPQEQDTEGHYLPLDDEGNVDFTPHPVKTVVDVEGHALLDLDIERPR